MKTSAWAKPIIIPVAAALLLLYAGVADAHVPSAALTCQDGSPVLGINLTRYNAGYTNTVSASVDGTVVLSTTVFGTSYSNSFDISNPLIGHTAQVVVKAGDDPTGSQGWTKTLSLSLPACQQPTPTPTPTPTATPTPTLTPTPTPTPTPRPTPSGSVEATSSASPSGSVEATSSASPSGGVEAATATPGTTVPATNAIGAVTGGPGSSLGFLIILFAAVLLAAGFAPLARHQQPSGRNARRR
jgi:hypothetical protein